VHAGGSAGWVLLLSDTNTITSKLKPCNQLHSTRELKISYCETRLAQSYVSYLLHSTYVSTELTKNYTYAVIPEQPGESLVLQVAESIQSKSCDSLLHE
jgi:hypothetical protein